MPAELRKLAILFTRGLGQNADAKIMPQGMFRRLENWAYEKAGRLRKSSAWNTIFAYQPSHFFAADATTVGQPTRCLVRDDEVMYADAHHVWSRLIDANGNVKALDVGECSNLRLKKRRVVHRSTDRTSTFLVSDVATLNGITVYCWQANNEIHVSIEDEATGSVIVDDLRVSAGGETAIHPQVMAGSTKIAVFYALFGGAVIRVCQLDCSNLGTVASLFSAPSSIITDINTTDTWYDICRSGTTATPVWVIAYHKTGHLLRVEMRADGTFDATGQPFYEVSINPETIHGLVSWGQVDDVSIYVATNETTNGTRIRRWNQSLTLQAGFPATLDASTNGPMVGIASTDTSGTGSSVMVVWCKSTSITLLNTCSSVGAVSTTIAYAETLASHRPFCIYETGRVSHVYLPCIMRDLNDGFNGLLLRCTLRGSTLSIEPYQRPMLHYAHFRMDWARHAIKNTEYAPRAIAAGDVRSYVIGADAALQREGTGGFFVAEEITAERLDIDANLTDTTAMLATRCAESLYLAGGMVAQFDGSMLTELGFLDRPICALGNFAAVNVGGLIAAGIYQWIIVLEWIDGSGRRHQSNVSDIVTLDMSGSGTNTNKVTITIPPAKRTWKQRGASTYPIYFVVYRTKAGPGGVFYRLEPSTNWPANDETSNVTFVDTLADASIADNEPLYISAGERNHLIPPSSEHVIEHNGRLAGIDSEYRNRIWFTAPVQPGFGLVYNDTFQQFVDGYGELTALASQDGKLYAFTRTAVVLAMYGDGPTASGAGGSFPQPQLCTQDAGAIDSRGVLVGPDGIYFVGDYHGGLGVYLWRRGDQGLEYIGRDIQDLLASTGSVTSIVGAVHVPRATQVRFVAGGNSALVFSYNYADKDDRGLGIWSTITQTNFSGAVGTMMHGTKQIVATFNGNAYLQEETSGVTGEAAILETGDIWPGGFMNPCRVARVSVLGELPTGASGWTLLIEASYDHGATYPDTHMFMNNSSDVAGYHIVRVWEPRQQELREGCVRYRMTLNKPSEQVPAADIILTGMTLEWQPIGGIVQVGTDRRA